LVMVNASGEGVHVKLPEGAWHCILDTAQEMGLVSPVATDPVAYEQQANSLSLWISHLA
jgi:hypothetical protein